MNRNDVYKKIAGYILAQLSVTEDQVTEKANMIEDLGADSVNVMMLIMDLENEFGITVEDDALRSIRTVGDIVDYIMKKV